MAQSSADITGKNEDREQIRQSNIKSKTIWEFRYVPGSDEAFSDSGYKAFDFEYDNLGRISSYTKYHIFSDLTVRETYRYGKTNNIEQSVRYNSAGDMIEAIDYKYNSAGRLKKEIHTAYYNGIRPGVYFSILANTNDDSLFSRVQEDLEIDPKLESYTITINISDPEEENQYLVIGDEADPSSPRYSWSQLQMSTQRGLLSYQGPNRKEHTYINKNIANVNYKYDKKGDRLEKSVYNTSNDIIERESYRYDTSGRRTGYARYNENGKLSGNESYSYDEKGNLAETIGLDAGGKLASRLSYKYDEEGNLADKIWYSAAGEVNSEYKYRYDGSRLIEETKFRGEKEKESRTDYEYDGKGNILDVIKYDANDGKEKLTKYVYSYF